MGTLRPRNGQHNTYYLIPFPEACSGSNWRAIAETWTNTMYQACTDTQSRYGNGNMFQNSIAELNERKNPHDMFYVFGHCKAGSSYILAEDHKTRLEADGLADVFAKLDTSWPGIVKLFLCEGGKQKSSVFSGTSLSFAQRFANEMVARGYDACSFYSYTDEVPHGRSQHPDKAKGTHKWEPGKKNPSYRASEVRIQIMGQVQNKQKK